MILVELREHRRHLTLAVCVVKRLVDRRRRDAQPRGGGAIEHQLRLNALRLLIARDVGQFRQLLQPGQHLRREGVQLIRVRVFERVLKLGAAHTIINGQILHRLHVKRDAGNLREVGLQPPDHVRGAALALVQRFQIDLDAPAVERGVRAVDADERRQSFDCRILQQRLHDLLLQPATSRRRKRTATASVTPWITPVS